MSDKSKAKIAFLGTGIMGGAMASNIAKAGYDITVWNRTENRRELALAVEAGARRAFSIQEAVRDKNIVMLCLSDVPDLESVLLGDNGVLNFAAPGTIVVDLSTTGPACAKKVAGLLAKKGLDFIDAPVTGGDIGARNATLTVMVGADKHAFEKCLPVFECIGKKIQLCGPCGAGQAVKLCNQILCAVNMLACCEALKLADLLEIDPALILEVCGSGAAGSWALSNLGPRIVAGDLEPGFMVKDMRKDLRLVREALVSADAPLELAATNLADSKFADAASKIGADGERKGTQSMSVAYK